MDNKSSFFNAFAIDTNMKELNSKLAQYLLINDILLVIYMVVGLSGNLLVIFIYLNRMGGNKGERFFIPWLAVLDTLAIAFGASFGIVLNVSPLDFKGDEVCRTLWYFAKATTVTASLLLLVIAVQRYLKICTPPHRYMTGYWKKFALVLTILTGNMFAIPSPFFYGEVKITKANITGFHCGLLHESQDMGVHIYINLLITLAVVGIVILAVLYVLIGIKIYKHFKQFKMRAGNKVTNNEYTKHNVSGEVISSSRNISNSEEILNSTNDGDQDPVSAQGPIRKTPGKFKRFEESLRIYRFTYIFMVITVLTVIVYTPRFIIMFMETLDHTFWDTLSDSDTSLYFFLYRFYLVIHVVNPFIYGLFDRRFRAETKRLFCPKRRSENMTISERERYRKVKCLRI